MWIKIVKLQAIKPKQWGERHNSSIELKGTVESGDKSMFVIVKILIIAALIWFFALLFFFLWQVNNPFSITSICPPTNALKIYLTSMSVSVSIRLTKDTSKGHLKLICSAPCATTKQWPSGGRTKEGNKGYTESKMEGRRRKRLRVCVWGRGGHPIKLLTLLWPVMAFAIATMPDRGMLIM